jgi:hypothetical protein
MTLLIVLGAGASYDSMADRTPTAPLVEDDEHEAYRPPLADNLFSPGDSSSTSSVRFRRFRILRRTYSFAITARPWKMCWLTFKRTAATILGVLVNSRAPRPTRPVCCREVILTQ